MNFVQSGGVAEYRASEGKTVEVPYRGSVINTAQDILGSLMIFLLIVKKLFFVQVAFGVVALTLAPVN